MVASTSRVSNISNERRSNRCREKKPKERERQGSSKWKKRWSSVLVAACGVEL